MITVSDSAKEHALDLMRSENSPAGTFIRVGVEGGGCSGLSYKLEFDNVSKEGDQVFGYWMHCIKVRWIRLATQKGWKVLP